MDKLIGQLEELNETVVCRLEETEYEELIEFVDRRQSVLDEMTVLMLRSTLTSAQKQRIQKLLQYDELIRGRMELLKQEASDWLRQRDQAKVQRSAYESAYSQDSILMDRRK